MTQPNIHAAAVPTGRQSPITGPYAIPHEILDQVTPATLLRATCLSWALAALTGAHRTLLTGRVEATTAIRMASEYERFLQPRADAADGTAPHRRPAPPVPALVGPFGVHAELVAVLAQSAVRALALSWALSAATGATGKLHSDSGGNVIGAATVFADYLSGREAGRR